VKRSLSWLWRALQSKLASAGRRRPVRLRLEQLDDRIVPSGILSSAISIYHSLGALSYTERDWYTRDISTGQVVEFQGTSQHDLGGPGNIVQVSASVDPHTGFAEVFALQDTSGGGTPHGPLWMCDSSGNWHNFGGDYLTISATRDGHVYAVTPSGDVRYLDSNGQVTDLGAPAAGVATWLPIAASVAWGGYGNEVFVIGAQDQAIYVNSGNSWRLVDNSAQFTDLSASQNDTLFAVTSSGKLYQETEHVQLYLWHFGWGIDFWAHQDISGGKTFKEYNAISADLAASGKAEVYALDTTGNAYLYDQGSWTWKDANVLDIAGADGGYFYEVNLALTARQFNPNQAPSWTSLGSNLF
jgi:hypothetical protein